MDGLHGGLEEEQAFLGVLCVDTGDLLAGWLIGQDLEGAAFDDPPVVIPGVLGVVRKPEAVLALHPAVAGRAVAALARQDAADVAGEAEGTFVTRLLDLKRGGRLQPPCRYRDARGSIRESRDARGRVETGDCWIRDLDLGFRRQVRFAAVRQAPQDQQLLRGVRSPQGCFLREQLDGNQLGSTGRGGTESGRKQQNGAGNRRPQEPFGAGAHDRSSH